MNKVLTIIVPTYNMERYLRKCLDSLVVSDDNMERLEVLVINDGSKDSSYQIAHEFEMKSPNTFHVIDKENGNYGSCINRGLKEATGKFVKVLDADDYYDARVLNNYIDFLSHHDVDLIISDFNVVDELGNCLSEFTFDLAVDQIFKLMDIPSEMNTKLAHHSITYKRAVFDRFCYKQTEGISYTDDEWIFKPMMWVENVAYFPQTLYFYLRGREGQTFDLKVIERTLDQRVKVAKEMISFYESNIVSCRPDNKPFVTDKLVGRIKALYNYHLIKYNTKDNKQRIIEFDRFLLNTSSIIYNETAKITNNYGWQYIRQWRNINYSNLAPALMFIRWKRTIKTIMKHETVKVDKMPKKLKRKKR